MLKSNVAAMPTAKDAEEYYCLRQPDPDEHETGSSLRSSPDVVAAAQKGKIITVRSESMAPGTITRVHSHSRCLQSQSRRRRSTCLASQSPHPRDGIQLPSLNATPAPSAALGGLGGGQRRLRQQRLQQRLQQLLHGRRWQRRRGRPVAALPAQECHRLGQEKQRQGEHEKRVSNRSKRITLWH